MKRNRAIGAIVCTSIAAAGIIPAHAALAKKPAVNATKGTTQMSGADGQFGQTYTMVGGGDYGPINFTLVSAEYSVERINMTATESYAPKANEKLLVIHYRIKNPNKDDFYYSSRNLFQTVTTDNTTAADSEESRRESGKELVGYSIKPGQGIDDLVTYAVIPAQGALPKLILQLGRAGSGDLVTRYMLGKGVNTVKPISAPYADPTGVTALAAVPAKVATTYMAGFFDISLDSVAFAPGPFGDTAADDGKRFLVATITATNKTWGQIYLKDTFIPTLTTSDDEKTTAYTILKGKRDEVYDGRQIDPGESITLRYLLQVPKDVTGKTLSIAEALDNSGDLSRAFTYDLSSVK